MDKIENNIPTVSQKATTEIDPLFNKSPDDAREDIINESFAFGISNRIIGSQRRQGENMNTDKPDAVELTRIGRAYFDANGNYVNSVQVMQIEFENQIASLTAELDRLKAEVEAARNVIRNVKTYAYGHGCVRYEGFCVACTAYQLATDYLAALEGESR